MSIGGSRHRIDCIHYSHGDCQCKDNPKILGLFKRMCFVMTTGEVCQWRVFGMKPFPMSARPNTELVQMTLTPQEAEEIRVLRKSW